MRTRECNQVVEIINLGAESIDRASHTGADANRDELQLIASALERAAADLSRLTLTVPGLHQRATLYAAMAARSAAAARELSAAMGAQDPERFQRASVSLQAAVEPEDSLIEAINAFCLGHP